MYQVALALFCISLFLSHKLFNSIRNYWPKRGVAYDKKSSLFGLSWDLLVGSRTLFELIHDLYNKFPDAPAVGTFSFFTPTLILKDPQNIEVVMTGDFNTFNDRGVDVDVRVDVLNDNVTFMNGIRWKLTRQTMTPLFTAAKLRNMYYIMDKSGRDFVDYVQSKLKEKAIDLLSKFCSASIAASVFGIHTEGSTLDSPFLKMAQKAVQPSIGMTFRLSLVTLFRKLMSILRIRFLELCVELQRKGTLRDAATGYEIEPTDEIMAAQAFFFFIAGVKPSATAMFFALFELAKHPDILDKLHDEVDDLFERCNDNPTYEDVTSMKYLDMVLDESMRIHPAVGSVQRRCTKNGGVLPVSKIHVEKGTFIHIPIHALHRDRKYYPEPEKFVPERFSDEEKRNIVNYTYMPFGEGHRMCLGMRFARLQVKTGLVHLLRHFTVETQNARTKMKFGKLPVQVRPLNIDVQFVPRSPR
ncbi:Cytochrome P450 6j1 [Eumeta japonica]|uniref:unspecific monooxygenase n=1 Tax=Eumeta variegata TaxID=151549 RepID=A0A4C1ZUE3_EUMVA|nr:Cytochrome P450 6j1 [Eumeta japonica]